MMGIVGTAVPMVAIVSSLQYQSSGVASILVTSGPALTVVLAHFFLIGESLTLRKSLGVILALSGALLLTLRGETGLPNVTQANPIGYGLVVISLFCFSGMTVYTRRYMRDFDSFDVTSIQIFAAAIVVMPISLLVVGIDLSQVDWQGYTALTHSAIIPTFLGFMLYFNIVRQFGATTAAMTNYIVPITASVGGVLLLGESVTAGMLVGMGIVPLGRVKSR